MIDEAPSPRKREFTVVPDRTRMHFLLVTDYCEQGSLADWIKRYSKDEAQGQAQGQDRAQQHEPFPQDTALRLAEEVALGMAFLHAQDMVHQDLKPDNVLITADTRAMVGDFGLAECLRSNSSPVSGKSRGSSGAEDVEGAGDVEGAVDETLRATHRGGSRDYIAPECWASGTCTRASDVYAFGILLHKLFVQHDPKKTYDWRDVLGSEGFPDHYHARLQEAVSKGLRPTLPPEGGAAQLTEPLRTSLYGLMQRCWHKDPKIRPTFEAVAEELRAAAVIRRAFPAGWNWKDGSTCIDGRIGRGLLGVTYRAEHANAKVVLKEVSLKPTHHLFCLCFPCPLFYLYCLVPYVLHMSSVLPLLPVPYVLRMPSMLRMPYVLHIPSGPPALLSLAQ